MQKVTILRAKFCDFFAAERCTIEQKSDIFHELDRNAKRKYLVHPLRKKS